MTVGELKKELEQMPDDAIAYFTLWRSDGDHNYWFNPSFGEKIHTDAKGRKYARIAFTDDCKAYRLETREEMK